MVVKQVGPGAEAAAASRGNIGCLTYLVDAVNSKRYLVDSGSSYSILPHNSSIEPTGPHLMTAAGTSLPCWGRNTCTVQTKGREFTWTFLLAPVSFLKNFNLMVDLSNRRLVERGGKLIPLELGSPSKAAVVAVGVVAPAPASGGVYFFSFTSHRPPLFTFTSHR